MQTLSFRHKQGFRQKFRPGHRVRSLLYALIVLAGIIATLPTSPVEAQGTNIALNKPTTASSTQSGLTTGAAVDNNLGTRWGSDWSDPQWLQIDLGATFNISRVVLRWEGAYGRGYQIQVSANATTWTTIYTTTTGDGGVDDLTGLSGSGRYIRMNGTVRATTWGYSLWEFEVYSAATATNTPTRTATRTNTRTNTPLGPTATRTNTAVPTRTNTPSGTCGATNIAVGKTATSSSDENVGTPPNLAVDGNPGTRWSSTYSDPQWLRIDLGTSMSICRVRLNWEGAYAVAYQIQVSNDGTNFTNIYSTTTGDGGIDDLTGLSSSGRYIRMHGTVRALGYGYSLWEFEVYSGSGGPTNTPGGPTPTRTNTPVIGGPVTVPVRIPVVEYLDFGLSPADLTGRANVITQNTSQTVNLSYNSGTSLTLSINHFVSGVGQSARFSAVDQGGVTRTGAPLTITVYSGLIIDVILVNNTPTPTSNVPTNTPGGPTPTRTNTPTATPVPSFSLISPANNAMITNTRRPTLTWNASSGAVRYEVWMNISRTDYDWTAPGSLLERYTKLGEVTGTSYTLTSDLPDRWTYKWYVIAVDGANARRNSNIHTFSLYIPTLETISDGINIINGSRDLNKNGAIEPYEDWRQPIETRVNDLLSRMTIQEKAFQMFYNAQQYPMSGWHFGPAQPQDLYNAQLATATTRLGIPFVSTGDTIHGYQTTYPTQIALAASRNYQNAYLVADMQRREQLPVGYRGTLGPLAEVDTKVLYPRFQEGNGENAEVAAAIMRAMTVGFQGGPELNPASVLVTTKHWPGEGAGGEAGITFDAISINYHMIPWRAAFEAGGGGVMPGYAGSSYLDPGGPGAGDSKPIIDYLRINMGYDGLVTTDWLPWSVWVRAANAGSDVMGGADPGSVGFDMNAFIAGVPVSRIDQALRRILRVKFKMGIFENPYGDPVAGTNGFHTPSNVQIATQAARDAMTLLKNTGVLPLRLNAGDTLLVTGMRANDGLSCCIWTSYFHDEFGAKTYWEAIQARAAQAGVNAYLTSAPTTPRAAIVITGEGSYTHGTNWNKEQPYLPADQISLIQSLKNQGIPVVVIYIMPRPYVITTESGLVDAIVVAYRPGDGGGTAMAELLFGDYEPKGRLPFQLPRDMNQIGTDQESNQLERWDLPYDLGATEAQRTQIRNQIAAGQSVTTTYGNPLYPFGAGIQGFGLVDGTPPAAFNLTAPANGSTVQNTRPTLTWGASSDAQTGIKHYEVWLDNVRIATVKTTQFALTNQTLSSGSHSWRVVAVNWAGGTTTSNTFTFNFTDTTPPNVFELVSPANAASVTGSSQTLVWESSFDTGAGVTQYEVWLDNVNVTNVPSSGQVATTNNLALFQPANASSTQVQSFSPAMAFDGNLTTRWESQYADPQWISIDLGKSMLVTRVKLTWEPAYATAYQIQVSNNGTTWTTIYSTTTSTGGVQDLTNLRGYGRYVRMNGTARATGYGYSLWEFEVYGVPVESYTRTGLGAGSHQWYIQAVDAFGNKRRSTSIFTFTVQ